MRSINACHNRQRRPPRGFTLVELVMTIIVAGITAIPLSLLVSRHMESLTQSREHTMALNLARFEMEKVNNLGYNNIVTGSFPNYLGYSYDVFRTVAYVQGNDASAESLKKVVVEVKPSGGSTVLASLVTYLAKNVTYGI